MGHFQWYHVFVACNYVSGGLLTYIHLYHNLKKDGSGFTTVTFVSIKLLLNISLAEMEKS